MDDYQEEFDAIESAAVDKRRQQDFDDLNNEMSGSDVGRIQKFLSAEAWELIEQKRTGKQSKAMSALEFALATNPVYAAAYKATVSKVREAQQTADGFRDQVDTAISKANAKIEHTLEAAVTLPDGRKAFMGKDGEARTVDRQLVDPAITAGIDWSGHPTWEEYQAQIEGLAKLEDYAYKGRVLSNRLGEMDNELHDELEPPTLEEVETYREEADGIRDEYQRMGEELQAAVNVEREFSPVVSAITPNSVPTL